MGLSFCSGRARTQTDRLPLAYLQHTPSVLSHTYTCILVLVPVYCTCVFLYICSCACTMYMYLCNTWYIHQTYRNQHEDIHCTVNTLQVTFKPIVSTDPQVHEPDAECVSYKTSKSTWTSTGIQVNVEVLDEVEEVEVATCKTSKSISTSTSTS